MAENIEPQSESEDNDEQFSEEVRKSKLKKLVTEIQNERVKKKKHKILKSKQMQEMEQGKSLGSNRGRHKKYKLYIGWQHFSGGRFRVVTVKKGGGTRMIEIGQGDDISVKEIIDQGTKLFFPNGKSSKGDLVDMEVGLASFSSENLEAFKDVDGNRCSFQNYLKSHGLFSSQYHLYVRTKSKEQKSTDVLSEEENEIRSYLVNGKPPGLLKIKLRKTITSAYCNDTSSLSCASIKTTYNLGGEREIPYSRYNPIIDDDYQLCGVLKDEKEYMSEIVSPETGRNTIQVNLVDEQTEAQNMFLHGPETIHGIHDEELILCVITSVHNQGYKFQWYKDEILFQDGVDLSIIKVSDVGKYTVGVIIDNLLLMHDVVCEISSSTEHTITAGSAITSENQSLADHTITAGISLMNQPMAAGCPVTESLRDHTTTAGSSLMDQPMAAGSSLMNQPMAAGSSLMNQPMAAGCPVIESLRDHTTTAGSSLMNQPMSAGSSLMNQPMAAGCPVTESLRDHTTTAGSSLMNQPMSAGSSLMNQPMAAGCPVTESLRDHTTTAGSSLMNQPMSAGSSLMNQPMAAGCPVTESLRDHTTTAGSSLMNQPMSAGSSLMNQAMAAGCPVTESLRDHTTTAGSSLMNQPMSAGSSLMNQPMAAGFSVTESLRDHTTTAGSSLMDQPITTGSSITDKTMTSGSSITDNRMAAGSVSTVPGFKRPTCNTTSADIQCTGLRRININEFNIGNVIGQGSFGLVKSATWLGTEVAIKEIEVKRMRLAKTLIEHELDMHSKVRHPNIIQCLGFGIDGNKVLIVSELNEGNNLDQIIFGESNCNQLLESDKIHISTCVIKAVAYLHNTIPPIIHRDIKPENVLVSNNLKIVRLCDLGISKFKTMNTVGTTLHGLNVPGTPAYQAPEVVLHRKSGSIYSDIWSVGCTILEIFTMLPVWDIPFDMPEPVIYIEQRMKDGATPDNMQWLSGKSKLVELMSKVLSYEQKARPVALELLSMFHSVFRIHN